MYNVVPLRQQIVFEGILLAFAGGKCISNIVSLEPSLMEHRFPRERRYDTQSLVRLDLDTEFLAISAAGDV